MHLIRKTKLLLRISRINGKFLRYSSYSQPKKWSYMSGHSLTPLSSYTLSDLLIHAEKQFGDSKDAFVSIHQKIRKNFIEFRKDVDNFSCGLLALGLKPGDRIGIYSPNNYEWILTQLAASRSGLILVNINPGYRASELAYCLNKVEVKAIVAAESFKTSNYYDIVSEAVPEIKTSSVGSSVTSSKVPSLEKLIMISEQEYNGAFKFSDICRGAPEKYETLTTLEKTIQFDDIVNIQFTSGTTGHPKGASLSHHNIVNNAIISGRRLGFDEGTHRLCLPVPLYHCLGCVLGILPGLYYGTTTVLPSSSFNALASLQAIQDEKCTAVYGTPTMFVDLVATQRAQKMEISSLKTGIMAGAPCPVQLCKDVMTHLNMKQFQIAYGSTETSPLSFQGYKDDNEKLKSETIGYPSEHIEIKIIDENGHVVPIGQFGELCTRGYSVMRGYWNDDEKTKAVISSSGWYHSGDTAVLLPNGYGQIVGRIKDMIIRGGENIYPREIEEFFYTHDEIQEIHVVGVKDERLGEEIAAWISLIPNSTLNVEQIKSFAKNKISHFKIPKYIFLVTSFPTTVTGKVQKFKMREETERLLNLNSSNSNVS